MCLATKICRRFRTINAKRLSFAIPIRTAAAEKEAEGAEEEERVEWEKGRRLFIAQVERLVKCDKSLQVWPNCIE